MRAGEKIASPRAEPGATKTQTAQTGDQQCPSHEQRFAGLVGHTLACTPANVGEPENKRSRSADLVPLSRSDGGRAPRQLPGWRLGGRPEGRCSQLRGVWR